MSRGVPELAVTIVFKSQPPATISKMRFVFEADLPPLAQRSWCTTLLKFSG